LCLDAIENRSGRDIFCLRFVQDKLFHGHLAWLDDVSGIFVV
jgi:hypothetical protein